MAAHPRGRGAACDARPAATTGPCALSDRRAARADRDRGGRRRDGRDPLRQARTAVPGLHQPARGTRRADARDGAPAAGRDARPARRPAVGAARAEHDARRRLHPGRAARRRQARRARAGRRVPRRRALSRRAGQRAVRPVLVRRAGRQGADLQQRHRRRTGGERRVGRGPRLLPGERRPVRTLSRQPAVPQRG